jgi:hypothetical protein
MMEMNWKTINYYFDHIHRTIRDDGIFYCVNRYEKKTSGESIKIREYPFDSRWGILLAQPSWGAPTIFEMLLARTETANKYPISKAMRSLGPWSVQTDIQFKQ